MGFSTPAARKFVDRMRERRMQALSTPEQELAEQQDYLADHYESRPRVHHPSLLRSSDFPTTAYQPFSELRSAAPPTRALVSHPLQEGGAARVFKGLYFSDQERDLTTAGQNLYDARSAARKNAGFDPQEKSMDEHFGHLEDRYFNTKKPIIPHPMQIPGYGREDQRRPSRKGWGAPVEVPVNIPSFGSPVASRGKRSPYMRITSDTGDSEAIYGDCGSLCGLTITVNANPTIINTPDGAEIDEDKSKNYAQVGDGEPIQFDKNITISGKKK